MLKLKIALGFVATFTAGADCSNAVRYPSTVLQLTWRDGL